MDNTLTPLRMMHGNCLCWRAQQRRASWQPSWPVSSSGSGRTEVFKPASAAPANISSTTRQHSESHSQNTHTQATEVTTGRVRHRRESSSEMTANVVHVRGAGAQNEHLSSANAQAAPAFNRAWRATCASDVSGLLNCQYLLSSTGPEEWLQRLFNLWPGAFTTCLKKFS